MLKKIAVDQLRLGMHLHKLEGRWMDHPFWKTRFVLTSADDLALLRSSPVRECWIDTAQGLDVAVPVDDDTPPTPTPGLSSAPGPVPVIARAPAPVDTGPRAMKDEIRQAAAICDKGREAVVAMFNEARMGRAVDAEGCLPLVDEISGSVLRNPGALVSLARLKSRDDYSYMHSVAVCALMVALGRQIGMSDDECRIIGLAGLMHDIGKALMPLEVLNKPARLTDEEFTIMRSHPVRGHEMLLEGRGATPEMLDVVLHHHERPDGRGYPHRLSGDQLSSVARMGAICDVYDAITSNRPYKSGWDPAESIAQMASWKGQFDEVLFAAFVQSLGIYPTGSLVRLHSGKLAVVVEQNAGKLVAPVVKTFYSTKSQMRITPERIDLARPGCADRIVGREPQEAGNFPGLDELWADPETLRRRGR
ncbi:HD-GYP domain-containing protein [Rubrivivax rivuli]|uniref:HD-GYP domain-containing protein n=1 Tax=Rubrivivax rivuli TaxID=1862385 RepID=A0A437RD02_9BURK|nr:HD-GYP domain-containing protein [Rubrivivax rivuli]RVU44631.1 HD-GYP domain-containing protein [Rubrivivax rivuli]